MENIKQDILSSLQSSSLFCGLNSQQLQHLAQKSILRFYRPGQILIEEGITNEKIILILDGLVKVYKTTPEGKEIFIAIENADSFLGILDLDDNPATASIEALQPTRVVIFSKKDLIQILDAHPYVWKNMYSIVLAKLRNLNQLHGIHVGNDLYQRTYLLLQYLSQFFPKHIIPLSQETIAQVVGATRPRVTETLQALKDTGKILLSPKKIIPLA